MDKCLVLNSPLKHGKTIPYLGLRSTPKTCTRSLPCNKIGIHTQVWVGDWSKESASKAIVSSKKAGYTFVELDLSRPEAFDARMTKNVLEEQNMTASGTLGLDFKHDISNPDPAIHKKGVKLLEEALKCLATVGGTSFGGVNYCGMGRYNYAMTMAQWSTLIYNLKHLATYAGDLGINYCVEVVNRYESNILNTSLQAMDLIETVNMANLGIHLDTYHMNIEEVSFDKAIKVCGDKLRYFHVGESHRSYLGTGSIDWQKVWQALASAKYTGPLSFESFSSAIVSPALSNALCVWRETWQDSEDLASKAREFIQSGIDAAYRACQ